MSLAYQDKICIPSMWEDTEEDIKEYKEHMKKEAEKLKGGKKIIG